MYDNTFYDYYLSRRLKAVHNGPEALAGATPAGAGRGGFAIAAGGPVTLRIRDGVGREIAFEPQSARYTSGIPQGLGMHRFQIAEADGSTQLPTCEVVVVPASESGNFFVTLEGHGTGRASTTFQTRSDPAEVIAVSDAQSVSAGSRAHYRLRYDSAGATSLSIASVADVSGERLPMAPVLRSAPNPSFGATSVRLVLPRAGIGHLRVLDLQGRVVATLRRGQFMSGETNVDWDGRTDRGQRCAPGLYFIRAAIGEAVVVGRIVLVQ